MTVDCSKINVKLNSKGNDVNEVQKYLTYELCYSGKIDGICGKYTVEAIKKYQKNVGLVVDGVFGKLTCQKSKINGKDMSSSTTIVSLNDFKDMRSRYNKFVKENGREPNLLYLDNVYKYEYITLKQYKNMVERYEKFIKDNGREPNSIQINKPQTNSTQTITTTPTQQKKYTVTYYCEKQGGNCLGQITGYHCGPHCIKQCLRKFGITGYSEKTIGSYAGTTSSGTGHSGLETAIANIAKKEGIKLKVEWKNFSDLGNTDKERYEEYGKLITSKNKAVFHHEKYRNTYGHYSILKLIDILNYILTVANSLGNRCNSPAYCGYMESRKPSTQSSYLAGISQKSICIITKE